MIKTYIIKEQNFSSENFEVQKLLELFYTEFRLYLKVHAKVIFANPK